VAATSTILYRSPLFTLGEFRCPAGDRRWSELNSIGEGDHMVFPGLPVGILHDRGRMTVADPNLVVYYRSGDHYRRELCDRRGDECVFLVLSREGLDGEAGAEAAFARRFAPAGGAAYVAQAMISGSLRRGCQLDPLLVEEALAGVVEDSLRRAARRAEPSPTQCDEATERVREILATRYAERRSLASIAAEVGVSPFHLARRFRLRTGRSLHQYREQVRLRLSLRLLREPIDLSLLALDLGYSSHSHFTNAFRRSFGVPPSALRQLAANTRCQAPLIHEGSIRHTR
jgi:AraC-like DNA-binding protein